MPPARHPVARLARRGERRVRQPAHPRAPRAHRRILAPVRMPAAGRGPRGRRRRGRVRRLVGRPARGAGRRGRRDPAGRHRGHVARLGRALPPQPRQAHRQGRSRARGPRHGPDHGPVRDRRRVQQRDPHAHVPLRRRARREIPRTRGRGPPHRTARPQPHPPHRRRGRRDRAHAHHRRDQPHGPRQLRSRHAGHARTGRRPAMDRMGGRRARRLRGRLGPLPARFRREPHMGDVRPAQIQRDQLHPGASARPALRLRPQARHRRVPRPASGQDRVHGRAEQTEGRQPGQPGEARPSAR